MIGVVDALTAIFVDNLMSFHLVSIAVLLILSVLSIVHLIVSFIVSVTMRRTKQIIDMIINCVFVPQVMCETAFFVQVALVNPFS